MKQVGQVLFWLLGGVFVLACIVLLGVNLYVQSQGTHRRIQQELSQRLGTPLTLRRISVTPWGGLKLNGITIPQEPGSVGGDFLRAQTFQLRVQFWSLFSDQLVIRQVSLIKPEVVWAQNEAGKWRLPTLPVGTPAPVATLPNEPRPHLSATATATAPVAAAPMISPNDTAEPAATPAQAFAPEVRRVNLRDGHFTFLDAAGRVVAKFDGLDFTSSFRTATAVKGSAKVEKISLRDRFFIEQLDSPLHYDPSELIFSNISAQAAGGQLTGKFDMKLLAEGSPFTATVKFREIEAEQLLTDAGGPPDMIEGLLEGSLTARGKTADSNALTGHGEIFLHDGKLKQYSLLVALGQILQIDELMQLQLEQAEVHFHINPGVVTVDSLLLRSPNIRLTATGTIQFNGRLRLEAKLALNDKIRRQLFAPIRENFQPVNDQPGYAAVPFRISGTVDRPKTDLMDKVVGHNLRDLGGVLSSLFGHGKKKKSQPTPTPTATVMPIESGLPNDSASLPATPVLPTP